MLTVVIFVGVMLLGFLCERVSMVVKSLSQIASSLSAINSQLIAFIAGGSTVEGQEIKMDDISFLSVAHLTRWGCLGRRVSENHAAWLVQSKQNKKANG